MSQKSARVDWLNLLKIIAFLCVFLLHTKIFLPMPWNENVPWAWVLYTPAWGAVWIFIVLSGYGIGRGFYAGRYEVSAKGIVRYWIKRLLKIVPVYWFFVFSVALFVNPVLLTPTKESVSHLLSLLFFNYYSNFDSLTFGAAWYLTTLMRLYIFAPLVFLLLRKIKSLRVNHVFLFALLAAGLVARIGMKAYISRFSGSWNFDVYVPFYFNLDVFFCGFLLANPEYRQKHRATRLGRASAFLLMMVLILFNSKLYYDGIYQENTFYIELYQYLFPTIYCLAVLYYIYEFDVCSTVPYKSCSPHKLKRAVVWSVKHFALIQLPIYLYHPVILQCLLNVYKDEVYSEYVTFLGVPTKYASFAKGCCFTVQALVLSLLWAVIVAVLFSGGFKKKGDQLLDTPLLDRCWDKMKQKWSQRF